MESSYNFVKLELEGLKPESVPEKVIGAAHTTETIKFYKKGKLRCKVILHPTYENIKDIKEHLNTLKLISTNDDLEKKLNGYSEEDVDKKLEDLRTKHPKTINYFEKNVEVLGEKYTKVVLKSKNPDLGIVKEYIKLKEDKQAFDDKNTYKIAGEVEEFIKQIESTIDHPTKIALLSKNPERIYILNENNVFVCKPGGNVIPFFQEYYALRGEKKCKNLEEN